MNSVLRYNNLARDSDTNVVDAVATRVVNEIRSNVRVQAISGANGVTQENMDHVIEDVFGTIERALGDHVTEQTNNFHVITNNMNGITTAQNMQIDAIAGHAKAIDNHVHAMGNNVNAMGSLLSSTNGNVSTLSTSIGTLQTVVTMLPQMVSKSVADILPRAIHGAVQDAFEAAITNELIARMQAFANDVQDVPAHGDVTNRPNHGTLQNRRVPHSRKPNKMRKLFSKLNIFKKRSNRRCSPSSIAN
jgi:archaellum component FlaC